MNTYVLLLLAIEASIKVRYTIHTEDNNNEFTYSYVRPDMFSNFEGGIIGAASLGFLEADKKGNVNPSLLPDRIYGPGGFPVIAGGALRIYFAGAFTAGKSEITISDNTIKILQDEVIPKFIKSPF
jgi:acyl CoA:acetate/3-ketoacid CoA transferase